MPRFDWFGREGNWVFYGAGEGFLPLLFFEEEGWSGAEKEKEFPPKIKERPKSDTP